MIKLNNRPFAMTRAFSRSILLLILLGITSMGSISLLYAQEVNYNSDYPKIAAGEPLVVYGDSAEFDVFFNVAQANITNAQIEISLPRHVQAGSVSSVAGGTALTWTSATTGATATGQKVMISITSNAKSLLTGSQVRFRLKAMALCLADTLSTEASRTFSVRILSGSTLIDGTGKHITPSILMPVIRLTSDTPNPTYTSQTQVLNHILKLSATNGYATSVKVALTANQYITLANFKLAGAVIPAANIVVTGTTTKVYTLNLTAALLGSKITETPAKLITFDASSTRCGSQLITTKADYPVTGSCLPSYTGVQIALGFPQIGGLPNMVRDSIFYANASNMPVAHFNNIHMDGQTSNTLKIVYTNKGLADAYDFVFLLNCNNSYTYADTANMMYQIEGGAKLKLAGSRLSSITNRGSGSTSVHYPAATATKPYAFNVNFDQIVPAGKKVTFWIPTKNGKIYDNGNTTTYTTSRSLYTHNFYNGFDFRQKQMPGRRYRNGSYEMAYRQFA